MKHTYPVLFLISLALLATLPTIIASDIVSAYVEPTYLELKPGEEFIISIKIDPRDKGVSGGEVKVDFDPEVFKCTDISPGNILGPSPLIGLKEIDDVKGSIRYAIARVGRTEPPTQAGVFAEIRFKVKLEADVGTHVIELVRIGLADEKFNNITDISIDNGFVKVKITREQSHTITTQTLTKTISTVIYTVTTTYTSSQYVTTSYYTYTSVISVRTQSTTYLLLAIVIIISLVAVIGMLAVLYLRGGRRRKPRVIRVE
jgi:ribosomal protein S8E